MQSRRNQAIVLLLLVMGGVLAGGVISLYRLGGEREEAQAPIAIPSPTPQPAAHTPTAPLRPDGSPYPNLFAPTAGISEYIIESYLTEDGWQVDHLGNRIGHLQGTSWVGQGGNIVLAGHVEDSEGRPAVFAQLQEMQVGDPITVTDQDVTHQYQVVEVKTVESDDLSVVLPTPNETLTLITCTNYNFIKGTYEQRIIVHAKRIN